MRGLDFIRRAVLSCVATASLAGCGGSQTPIGAPGAMPQSPLIAGYASWIAPDAKSRDLIYAGSAGDDIFILSYPQGKLIRSIMPQNTFSQLGLCSDANGNVFVTSRDGSLQGFVYEYAHGGTEPIETLSLSAAEPAGCSVDPTTGDLAVTTFGTGGQGEVAVYKNAQGTPQIYTDPRIMDFHFCGYDNSGNLFVDGDPGFQLAELPKGSNTFIHYTLNKQVEISGQIQWDGSHVTLAYQAKKDYEIYRLQFSGSTASIVSTTKLKRWNGHGVVQSWIQDGQVLVATGPKRGKLGFWPYPTSGRAVTTTSGLGAISGVTVSVAPNR